MIAPMWFTIGAWLGWFVWYVFDWPTGGHYGTEGSILVGLPCAASITAAAWGTWALDLWLSTQ